MHIFSVSIAHAFLATRMASRVLHFSAFNLHCRVCPLTITGHYSDCESYPGLEPDCRSETVKLGMDVLGRYMSQVVIVRVCTCRMPGQA